MTPLHHWGQALREALQQIPLEAVRGLFVAALVALWLWVLLLPNSATCPPDSPRPAAWENLKWWAALALAVQIAIYALH